jgi:IMP dehydrogenase
MHIVEGLTFDDVLLIPKYSEIQSRSEVDLSVDLGKGIKLANPIVSANMKNVTGPKMAGIIAKLGGLGLLHRFCSITEQLEMIKKAQKACCNKEKWPNIGASVGVQYEDRDRAKTLIESGCRVICIDVAHAHSKICMDMTEHIASWIANHNKGVLLISGNIATYRAAKDLIMCGADVIKVGIGNGSLCSTRVEAGAGVPQLTALDECMQAIRDAGNKNIKIIADGGLRRAGDCVKALVFSDAVMLGNMLSGTTEAPGGIITINDVKYKEYEGSSTHKSKHVEGVKGLVPLKGPVDLVVQKILEGIKSGCSYQGAKNLKELRETATFVRISSAGLSESHPHSVMIR